MLGTGQVMLQRLWVCLGWLDYTLLYLVATMFFRVNVTLLHDKPASLTISCILSSIHCNANFILGHGNAWSLYNVVIRSSHVLL